MPTRVITWHDSECRQFASVQQFARWATDTDVDTIDVWFIDLHRTHTVRPCTAYRADGLWVLDDLHGTTVAASRPEWATTPRQRALLTRLETFFDELDVVAVSLDEWGEAAGFFGRHALVGCRHELYEPYGFRPVDMDTLVLEVCPLLIDLQATFCRLDDAQWSMYLYAFETRLKFRMAASLGDCPDVEAVVDEQMLTAFPDGYGIMNDVALSVLRT
jgi:hypothetical protein